MARIVQIWSGREPLMLAAVVFIGNEKVADERRNTLDLQSRYDGHGLVCHRGMTGPRRHAVSREIVAAPTL